MTIIVEGPRSIHLSSSAHIVEDDREVAWAEQHVVRDPSVKWILGNYVEADNANDNGHIFPLADLKAAQASISHKPLNLLHRPHQIVGAFVASEMLYPQEAAGRDNNNIPTTTPGHPLSKCGNCGTQYHKLQDDLKCPSCGHTEVVDLDYFPGGKNDTDDATKAAAFTDNPRVEALSVFWKYYFPDLYDTVEAAHAQGQLFYSMECVPETVGCIAEGCTGVFAYKGRNDPTYCEHLNAPGARKMLNQPHFTAGALIIPPVRPGWKHADIKEVSHLIEVHADAEAVYDKVSKEMGHLSANEWEAMMAFLLAAAETSRT